MLRIPLSQAAVRHQRGCKHSMNLIYHSLSNVKPLAKSYTFKFLFVAFLGIHIPLIGLIVFIVFKPQALSPGTLFLITLGLTLGATGITLFILNKLLEPLSACKAALENYLTSRTIPDLPKSYTDEAGILMREVQETVNSLDMLLEEKKDLIGLLSHDLRTPLATILLIGKQLEREPEMKDEQRRRLATMITESTSEQLRLFKRILELLRNDDIHKLHLQLAEVKVLDVLHASLQDLQMQAEQKNLQIHVNCGKNQCIQADSVLISQVIKNLLNNAIKFSHPGTDIDVQVAQQGDRTSISVADKGLGFEPEEADKLFQRFTDKRKLGTANEASTGMGLYLSSKIVKAHNGSIKAKSAGVNQGATFVVEL